MISKFLRNAMPKERALIVTVGLPVESTRDAKRISSRQSTTVDLDQLDLAQAIAPTSSTVLVLAQTTTDLRRAVSLSQLLPTARRVVIAVATSPQHRMFSLPLVSPELSAVDRLALNRGPESEWVIEARFSQETPVGLLLGAVVKGFQRHRPHPIQRVALSGLGAADWRPGDPDAIAATAQGPLDDLGKIPPADLVLRTVAAQPLDWNDPRVKVVDMPRADRLTWSALGRPSAMTELRNQGFPILSIDSVPPVDEYSINPMGFITVPTKGVAELVQKGDRWVIQGGGLAPITVRASGIVADAEIAMLRPIQAISINWGRHVGPLAAVRAVASLAMAGVPLTATGVPAWAAPLGPELTQLITEVRPEDMADEISREVHSIRLRRAAMRTHSTRARWQGLAAATAIPLPSRGPANVSVVLCTMRPDFIDFALAQLSRQRHVDFEVILTLHDLPIDLPEIKSAIARFDKPLTVIDAPGNVSLGEALNRGADAASGYFVAKWDDDDWYSPDHLADLVYAAQYSGAELVGCAHQLTYLEQIDLTVYHPKGDTERFNKHIAGSTLLIDRHAFHDVGRFRPVQRGEDSSLLRAVVAAGGRYYRTHGLGYLVSRRASGHTWDVPITHFMRNMTRQWRGFQPGALFEIDHRNRSRTSTQKAG